MHHQPYNPRPRAPVALILIVALVALSILAGVLSWAAWQWYILDQTLPTIATALRVLLFVSPLAAGGVGLAIAWRRWGSHEYIKASHITRLTQAQNQRLPAGVTNLSYHDSSRPQLLPPVAAEPEPLALPPPSVPTFGQLLDSGKIGPGQKLILGIDVASGQALEGSWRDLYSTGVGGMTGSGKSWAGAFLIAQSAAAGARLIVVDPHAGDDESLATRIAPLSAGYMCNVASSGAEIESALKLATGKLEGRKAGRGGSWPLLLVVDEWTSLLRGQLGDLLTATALDIAEQGRKYGVFCLLAAQAWQVEAAGPVRDRLASHYVLRTRGEQLRYQLGLRAGQAPLDSRFLKDGEAYLLTVRGDLTRIVIPHMTGADLERVGAMIAQPVVAVGQPFGFTPATRSVTPSAQIVAENRPERSQNVAAPLSATSASGPATAASPEAVRAAELFVTGSSPADIVRELRGVGSREGSRYQMALNEILDLIRAGVRGA